MRGRLIAAALMAAAALTVGCQGLATQAPVPGRVAIAGDSITIQAAQFGGTYISQADFQQKIGLGWKAGHAQPRLTTDSQSRTASPACLVLAFGANEADGSVLTQAESNAWMAATHTAHPQARVVWVLPHTTNPAHQAVLPTLRTTIQRLAASRPNTRVVDWRPVVQAHPEYLADDGVHLREGTGAGAAYAELMRSGCA